MDGVLIFSSTYFGFAFIRSFLYWFGVSGWMDVGAFGGRVKETWMA